MRRAFRELVEAELSLSERLENLSEDSITYWKSQPVQHSTCYSNYQHMVITVTDNDTSFFDLNIYDYNFSYLANTYGIVKVGGLIYQFTKDYVKYIDNGDPALISSLLTATSSDASNNIVVKPIYYSVSAFARENKKSSMQGTSTFVRSAAGNNGRFRVYVYQDWLQNTSSVDAQLKVSSYWVKVRSLRRRLFGAWYDNYNEWLSCSGNIVGNQTWGQLSNNISNLTINWTAGFNESSPTMDHTLQFFLPRNQGFTSSMRELRTDGYHPEIYSSSVTGNAVNVQATSIY